MDELLNNKLLSDIKSKIEELIWFEYKPREYNHDPYLYGVSVGGIKALIDFANDVWGTETKPKDICEEIRNNKPFYDLTFIDKKEKKTKFFIQAVNPYNKETYENKCFLSIETLGELFLDRIIFESNFPILFTCVNKDKEIFLCNCCHRGKEITWLINKSSKESITKMLKNEITIREALLENKDFRFSVESKGESFEAFKDLDKYWNEKSEYLPKENEYLNYELSEIEKDLKHFE